MSAKCLNAINGYRTDVYSIDGVYVRLCSVLMLTRVQTKQIVCAIVIFLRERERER